MSGEDEDIKRTVDIALSYRIGEGLFGPVELVEKPVSVMIEAVGEGEEEGCLFLTVGDVVMDVELGSWPLPGPGDTTTGALLNDRTWSEILDALAAVCGGEITVETCCGGSWMHRPLQKGRAA